ncbi:unnamed protein product [Protopolystoma xenopodis]|uniref:Uncharacterized protein n=1 Tax=Protopolystoma xenopodis TaxID=117903 RepID=A0A3S5CLR4_9PLAT|nr:unnamed protein product [Protopolystoma xenopodis]
MGKVLDWKDQPRSRYLSILEGEEARWGTHPKQIPGQQLPQVLVFSVHSLQLPQVLCVLCPQASTSTGSWCFLYPGSNFHGSIGHSVARQQLLLINTPSDQLAHANELHQARAGIELTTMCTVGRCFNHLATRKVSFTMGSRVSIDFVRQKIACWHKETFGCISHLEAG